MAFPKVKDSQQVYTKPHGSTLGPEKEFFLIGDETKSAGAQDLQPSYETLISNWSTEKSVLDFLAPDVIVTNPISMMQEPFELMNDFCMCYNPSMSTAPENIVTCTQCGGDIHPDEGQIFVTCSYCGTTVFLDPAQVVFHWYLAPTLSQEQATGQLYRWMSGSQTVKDLDKKSQVTGTEFLYFPLWYFLYRWNGSEQVGLETAAATSVTEITRLALPAGDLKLVQNDIQGQSVSPTVPLITAQDWLAQKKPGSEIKQSALVHIPIYQYHYQYRNQNYSAIVEAATGTVLANIFPAKAEAPYLVAGGITALVYLCLAILALGSFQVGGFSVDAGVAIILGVIAAPILFFMAVMVASRV